MKVFYKKLLPIFLHNILYKTLFAKKNVRNNYLRRNYLSIKILCKNDKKKFFVINFFDKFGRKISCNM